jgi:predicted nucleic acid-binding Zn ribbon protein
MALADPPQPTLGDTFPATRGERVFVACLLASLLAALAGLVVSYAIGPRAGVAAGAVTVVVVAVYVIRFMAVDPPAALRDDVADSTRACAWCGAEFAPLRPNQRYCSSDCRRRAANERRRDGTTPIARARTQEPRRSRRPE